MSLTKAQRLHYRINQIIVRVCCVAVLVIVFYQLWAIMGWYACIGNTAFEEHTRVTQACMDAWMGPIDGTASLLYSSVVGQ